ncbi:radical SAM protein [Candidatus Woesearchaeota archaeon]|nr:radical SAM protein [Candidatus Woesearchaeota archaeon]
MLGIRVDTLQILDDNFLKDLSRSGCVNIDSGIESGNDRILKMIRKGITSQQVREVNKKMGRYNFNAKYTFILGYPSETKDEMMDSVRLALQLVKDNKNAYTPFFVYAAYPGVGLWEIAKQYGLEEPKKLEDWCTIDFDNAYNNYPWLNEKQIKIIKNIAFTSFFANKNIKYKISRRYLRLLFDLYQPFAKLRFRYNLYQFPIDRVLAKSVANSMY